MTYNGPPLNETYHRNHERILGRSGLYYRDATELTQRLIELQAVGRAALNSAKWLNPLSQFSELEVMECFVREFELGVQVRSPNQVVVHPLPDPVLGGQAVDEHDIAGSGMAHGAVECVVDTQRL